MGEAAGHVIRQTAGVFDGDLFLGVDRVSVVRDTGCRLAATASQDARDDRSTERIVLSSDARHRP